MSNGQPEGMCKDCRVEPAEERADGTLASRCRACADARNEAAKAARAKAKRKGLCTYPGRTDKVHREGKLKRSYCKPHLAYFAERMRAN